LEIGLRIGGFAWLSLQEYRNKISLRQKGAYRIMCLGESTTALGGKDSYPAQLEEILNQKKISIKFSVINKGVPATNSTAIVSLLEENLDKYHPDMVVAMMSINDGEDIIPWKDELEAKGISSKEDRPFFKKSKIYKLAKLLSRYIINKIKESDSRELKEGKKEDIIRVGGLMPSSNYKEQEEGDGENKKIDCGEKEYQELGDRFRDQGEFDKAIEMYKKALGVGSEDDQLYVDLALCYLELRDFEKTAEMFREAIKRNSRNDAAYAMLGEMVEDSFLAQEMFEKAIEINPRNTRAYITLGEHYKGQGKYDQAIEIFKEAMEANPGDSKIYGGLALCYQAQRRYKLAEEYFEKANKLRSRGYNPVTRSNYQRLKNILSQKKIVLVCVQYPMRSARPLKRMFTPQDEIIFVDNERVFKQAVRQGGYAEYFDDNFGGDFGHCTRKGNRLLAGNIAKVIFKEYFGK